MVITRVHSRADLRPFLFGGGGFWGVPCVYLWVPSGIAPGSPACLGALVITYEELDLERQLKICCFGRGFELEQCIKLWCHRRLATPGARRICLNLSYQGPCAAGGKQAF
jgi:hypothetical protein